MRAIVIMISCFAATCFTMLPTYAQESLQKKTIAPAKPLVAVPAFQNRTKGHVTRIAPGKYKEKNVRVGYDRRGERFEKEGKQVNSDSHRDVYEKQLERVVEYGPGEWELPAAACEIAADEASMALTQSRRFRVMSRSKFSIKMRNEEDVYAGTSADLKILRDLKVSYLVLGEISRFRIDETKGTAYGVDVNRITVRVTMDLRAVDVETGEIACQLAPSKLVSIRLLDGTTSTMAYDWEDVLRTAIRGATKDLILQLAKGSGASTVGLETVPIHINSNPAGADILVDGAFVGNTPADITVDNGRCTLRLERQGYQPWERVIKAFKGMKVSPFMEKYPDAPKPDATLE